MNLKIILGTVGYNNKILVSNGNFSLGKNEKVNAGLAKSEEETMTKQTTTIHKVVTKAPQLPEPAEKAIITHEDEKIAVILLLAGGFMVWYMFWWTEKISCDLHYSLCPYKLSITILCTTSTQNLMRLTL